ncbi:hypothetical protein D9M68_989010 [compost metagenome]
MQTTPLTPATLLSWPLPKTVAGAEREWAMEEVVEVMIDMIHAHWKGYGEDGDSLEDHYETALRGAAGAIDEFFGDEFDDYPESLEIVTAAIDLAIQDEFTFWAQQENE